MSHEGGDGLSWTSDTPFLGPRQTMELQELTRRPKRQMSLTLGELLQLVGDTRGDNTSRGHQVLDVSEPTSFPFVLSFNNLTYSVKVRQKMTLPSCFRPATEHTKTLLNDISVFSGSPTSLPEFFSAFGHPIPENENRTEFALDLIRELEVSLGGTKSLVDFHRSWQLKKSFNKKISNGHKLSLKDAISASISRGKLVSGTANVESSNLTSSVPTFANPFWVEVLVIAKRSIMNSRRMPELFGMRVGAVLITGIILATMFWRLDDSPKGIQERIGFFAFAMSTTFYTCAEAIPVFLMERYIFMRETAYNAYRRSSYVVSHSITSIPAILFLSITFAATTYWAVGLAGGIHGFLWFFTFTVASFWAGSSFVTFLSGVISHVMLGDRIPPYWIWFHYISLVKYPYEGVLQNEFHDPSKCFMRGVQMFDNSPLGAVPTPLKLKLLKTMSKTLGLNITSTTCVMNGLDILKAQGITDISMWSCLWITVAVGFFFRIMFYFSLLLGSKNKRR
ncbi:hypothetical protein Acr_08g0017640 [Actinidia rufa]|uniref:ABC-2 type transporter transmembrane domain-containing protein n=1 Tax=Actinidia rufa TaxID=165716 RepID=A0A7J0F3V1_9ERIC|nr:hypothetical protein Acr_08g0017640 [Actinidia rufa]